MNDRIVDLDNFRSACIDNYEAHLCQGMSGGE